MFYLGQVLYPVYDNESIVCFYCTVSLQQSRFLHYNITVRLISICEVYTGLKTSFATKPQVKQICSNMAEQRPDM